MMIYAVQLIILALVRNCFANDGRELETQDNQNESVSINSSIDIEIDENVGEFSTFSEDMVEFENVVEFETITVIGENPITEVSTTDETNDDQPSIRFYDYGTEKYPTVETLDIKPLHGNNLLVSFNFEANGTAKLYPEDDEILYYDVFPKSLGTVLKSTNTRELHIRFGHGWYDSELNGKLVNNGFSSGGTGVELWATIEAHTKEQAFQEWIQLANSLSGMFCASLNFIDSSITTTPEKIFTSNIDLESKVNLKGNLYRFRSSLPREPICTENLTPFLKLLSTKGKQGISSLLTGNKMFNAEWTSMSIDVLTNCDKDIQCKQILKQSINMILNVPKILERNDMPIPKPTPGSELRCDESKIFDVFNCFPLPPTKEYHFSLIDLFGKSIKGGSLIGLKPTTVCLDIDLSNWEVEMLSLVPIKENYQDSKICFELDSNADYNIRFNTKDSSKTNTIEPPPFYASRSLSGYSQDSGGFRLDLHNPNAEAQKIVIFETLPWFVRFYLHSLTLSVTSESGTKVLDVHDPELSNYIKNIIYNPAVDRVAPSHLELQIEAPPQTKLKFSFKFDKSMLLYSEYPPDANHGFELEPTIFALIEEDEDDKINVKYVMRTTTSLLTLPTPDFSMPYNVIILTLTVMALTFGSIFNMLVKKTITEEEAEKLNSERPIEKLKRKIRKLVRGT